LSRLRLTIAEESPGGAFSEFGREEFVIMALSNVVKKLQTAQ
jgi:hypothetical protein